MNAHHVNLPFLAFNLLAIAMGFGWAPLHVILYCVQAFCYIRTLKLEKQLKEQFRHA